MRFVKKVENQVQNARNRAKISDNKLLTRFIYPRLKQRLLFDANESQ
jgi:hypothetical protein